MQQTIKSLLDQASQQLAPTSATPRLDAELLLAHCLNQSRSYCLTWPEQIVDNTISIQFENWVARRAEGEPIAYLVGHRAFWDLDLIITPEVLIPRPETELLVEWILQQNLPQRAQVLELGTGSGAIALALAHEKPKWQIVATDHHLDALTLAQKNAEQYKLNNVEFLQGNWYEAAPNARQFDVIVSNPPYIGADDPHLALDVKQYEPEYALISGANGLDAIHTIVDGAPQFLVKGGYLVLEHGFLQGAAVVSRMEDVGFVEVNDYPDMNGCSRMTVGMWHG